MVSSYPQVAERIATCVLTSYINDDEGDNQADEESGEHNRRLGREYTRNGCVVLAELSSDANLNEEVRVRVDVAIENVTSALKALQVREKQGQ